MFASSATALPALGYCYLSRSRHMSQAELIIFFSFWKFKSRIQKLQVSIEYGSKFESFKTTIYFHKGIEARKVSLQYKRKMKWKKRMKQ